ncbi:MAG: sigma 54-interacting transcriptional regulator [Bdellovibrionales bacterium]|nr:sigma 54-interacting transcriptional regulator [Bdellovibrionales bacterium]
MGTELLQKKANQLNRGYLTWRNANGRQVTELCDGLTLGRDGSNHVVLSDSYVSQRHCRIELRFSRFIIRDLRSKNGVFVNGTPVIEAELKDEDCIKLGHSEITVTVTHELNKENLLTLSSLNSEWHQQLLKIPSVAQSDLPVLLTGPSGAGKEVIANALHKSSKRKLFPLVCVNCSALNESLIESELFGHIKGSFTGATHDRLGAFEEARGGTLFLDEIGDLPLTLQPKLLRALENAQFRPVGSDQTRTADVRIIAATHHNLGQQVQNNTFRRDLYFRINVIRFRLPSLLQRMEDFEDLLYYFAKIHRVGFTYAAIAKLKEHSWPGNVRELRNVVARAKAYFPNERIDEVHLETLIERDSPQQQSYVSQNSKQKSVLKDIELELIQSRLIANLGNQRMTAQDLGIPKSTLHDRIKTYGINVKELLREKF